jgi:translation initiation factor 3 subunit B
MHVYKPLTFSFRYIFLEYASPAHAVDAVKNADGYKLDKQHTFRVNLFTDFDK